MHNLTQSQIALAIKTYTAARDSHSGPTEEARRVGIEAAVSALRQGRVN